MKQFNLKEYLESPRDLVTRCGKPARIICNDLKNDPYIVVAAITNVNGLETVTQYTASGEWTEGLNSQVDLFFAPKKKEGWINIYGDSKFEKDVFTGEGIYKLKEDAEKVGKNKKSYITTTKIEWEE